EDPEELQARLEQWLEELDARTGPERFAVGNAVDASWRIDRTKRAEAAALTRQVGAVGDQLDEQLIKQAGGFVDLLGDEPSKAVRGLRQSWAGCSWLMAQWRVLGDRLAATGWLEESQWADGIVLMGKPTAVLFDDPAACRWVSAHLGALASPERPME